MAIDFLGREIKEPKKKTDYEVRMHRPQKEKEVKKAVPQKKKKNESPKTIPVLQPQEQELGEVNFMTAFRRYLLKKRLTLIIIFVIILTITGGIAYYFTTRPTAPPMVVINTDLNQPLPENINVNLPPEVINENINLPPEPPEPEEPSLPPEPEEPSLPPEPEEPLGPLPDTELAPLRGTIVKFADQDILYLIETNGELRYIDKASVIFKNGENITQIGTERIYTINDRFKDIRKGKTVFGWIDWDPRVLTQSELLPFQ